MKYRAVIVNPSAGPAMVTEVAVDPDALIKADSRFDIAGQFECGNDRLELN